MGFKSGKQKRFIDALEHNNSFAQKVRAGKPVNMGSNIQSSIKEFSLPPIPQSEAMNPSVKFKKLRSKLKY
jgi:hypothetical protein